MFICFKLKYFFLLHIYSIIEIDKESKQIIKF